MVEHFGEKVRGSAKYGLRLVRDKYALPNDRSSLTTRYTRQVIGEAAWAERQEDYVDEEQKIYKPEVVEWFRGRALTNFDLNMAYFERLDQAEFTACVSDVVASVKGLMPVQDLKEWDLVSGVYVMVLGEYKQVYIGQAEDIRARIKKHWAGTKQLDRLVFGSVESSRLSISSFRALDTTAIYAKECFGNEWEERVRSSFPDKFVLNRINGGIPLTPIATALLAAGAPARDLTNDAG